MPAARRRARALRGRRAFPLPDDDPLAALPNLFDAAIVFAVALMVALAAALRLPLRELSSPGGAPVIQDARPVPLRPADDVAGGRGERVGVAYRLRSGEMVYVPDSGARKETKE